jgi:o-succinylbenzoate---CoA ligase
MIDNVQADLDNNDRSTGESIYQLFTHRLQHGWLVGHDGGATIALASQKLIEFNRAAPKFIVISTHDLIEFVANLMAGLRLGIPIFLGNPDWGEVEWLQVTHLTDYLQDHNEQGIDRRQYQGSIMIPTGGSSGQIKFAMHTWQTLSASVWGFQAFYELTKINTLCTLPLYHVSGLIQLCRSLLTDGQLWVINFRELCSYLAQSIDLDRAIAGQSIDLSNYLISLVPTQLAKLLDLDPDWLSRFQLILLGGAPPPIELLTRARIAKMPLALTYGMTETASLVTGLKPAAFLAGNNSCGQVLPHAEIQLRSLDGPDRKSDLKSELKSIQIKAKSLMLGYFPDRQPIDYFEPDDLGKFMDVQCSPDHRASYLTILGRNSSKIITGGENVLPIEVVNAIVATGLVADVWVVGLPDNYWGQVVTAIYVAADVPVSPAILANAIVGKISNYKIPKYWFPVVQIPRNSLGKVLVQAALELAEQRRTEFIRLLFHNKPEWSVEDHFDFLSMPRVDRRSRNATIRSDDESIPPQT